MDVKTYFSKPPPESCTLSIVDPSIAGYVPDLKKSFETLFGFMMAGVKELYGDVNVVDLSKEQMMLIGKYMMALGVEPNVQAKVNVETKEITALRVNFKPLVPMFYGIDKFMVKFEDEK